MSFSKIKSALIYLSVSLLFPLGAYAQSANSVPPSATAEYSALNAALGTFQTSLDKRTQSASNTPMMSKLMSADASSADSLLKPAALKLVASELSLYKSMGIQGVVIHTGFPILSHKFYVWNNDPDDFAKYQAFYQQVYQMCQAAGMKVLVESHALYPTNAFALLTQKFTKSLSNADFQNAMADNNGNIAALKPDCISIVSEPDTDYAWTTQAVYNSPSGLANLVKASVQAIKSASPKVYAVAGAPQWMDNAQQYDSLLYQIAGLDAIDIHIYFCGNSGFETATNLADNAHLNGKDVVVSECWLTKAGTGTPPAHPEVNQANYAMAEASFSFWQPLDAITIYSFFKWCNVEHPHYFTFFYTQVLFAYLNYSQWGTASNDAIIQADRTQAKAAMTAGQLTPTGAYYSKMLTSPRLSHY